MDGITTLCNKCCSTLKPGLDITSISTLYKTTMTLAYTRIRILCDKTVNSALKSNLTGKKNWLRKNSITDYAEKCFTKIPSHTMQKNVSPSHIIELWSSRNAWLGRLSFQISMLQKNENNCQWKSIFWKWNFLERTYRNTHKTGTFSLPGDTTILLNISLDIDRSNHSRGRYSLWPHRN